MTGFDAELADWNCIVNLCFHTICIRHVEKTIITDMRDLWDCTIQNDISICIRNEENIYKFITYFAVIVERNCLAIL